LNHAAARTFEKKIDAAKLRGENVVVFAKRNRWRSKTEL
jgi:hypothetical protein